MNKSNSNFINSIQCFIARTAIGPSTARNQGAINVVSSARKFFANLNLASLSKSKCRLFEKYLDKTTLNLQKRLPKKANSWGLSRKMVNLFFRDCAYNTYLRSHYKLKSLEPFLEIPLDSITAKALKGASIDPKLLKWSGVKKLDQKLSKEYQKAAQLIAKQNGVNRVHLDALFWGKR